MSDKPTMQESCYHPVECLDGDCNCEWCCDLIELRHEIAALTLILERKAIVLAPGTYTFKTGEIGYLRMVNGSTLNVPTLVCTAVDANRIIGAPRP